MSPCRPGEKGGVVVLYLRRLALQVSTIFVDQASRLDVLDMIHSDRSFRLVGVYAPQKGTIQNYFFRRLEVFLVT